VSDADGTDPASDAEGRDTAESDADALADAGDTESGEDATVVSDASDVASELVDAERCGDGVISGIEECDDGAANSDSTPNACRTDCRRARCGDGVVDADETCDDDNGLGGDGCSPQCGAESGAREEEPNDVWNTSQRVSAGTRVVAGLTEFDTDCFRVSVPEGGWIQAVTSSATPDTVCDVDTSIRLFGPTGIQLASDADSGDELCAVCQAMPYHSKSQFVYLRVFITTLIVRLIFDREGFSDYSAARAKASRLSGIICRISQTHLAHRA
jgi:cysteine-rich repeat protein